MKKVSDYKGDSIIDLYAEILEPVGEIIKDEEIVEALRNNKTILHISGIAFRNHKEAVKQFVLSIDNEEINSKNLLSRFAVNFIEILNDKDFVDFFKNAEQTKTDVISFGSVTESTGENED